MVKHIRCLLHFWYWPHKILLSKRDLSTSRSTGRSLHVQVVVGYPNQEDEKEIFTSQLESTRSLCSLCWRSCRADGLSRRIVACHGQRYHCRLCTLFGGTRKEGGSNLARYISFGASPRASLSLLHAARAHAFIQGRSFVTPDDVKPLVADVLRHRIGLTYEAQAEGIHHDWLIRQLVQQTRTP